MRPFGLLAGIFAALLLAGCASAPTPSVTTLARGAATRPAVIVISIDGYRADYFDRHDNPVLERLAAEGVHARWLVPSFPTLTYPNHYAMITGRYPDHNGIVDNYMDDASVPSGRFAINHFDHIDDPRWWNEATPLWVTLQRTGRPAAEMDWPGADVMTDGMLPALHVGQNEPLSPALRAATVIRWLDLPPTQRPVLTLVHFEVIDATGHTRGPYSSQLDEALRSVDAAIGDIIAALKRNDDYANTDIVVLSDHGMAPVAPGHTVFLDDIIPVSAVNVVTMDAMAGIDPSAITAGRAAAVILLQPHPHMHCWRKRDLPPHLHYGTNPRIPSIECLAEPGWLIDTHRFASRRPFTMRGEHGYDNAAPSMRALFIAEGPSFRRGIVMPPFPNVDVYPLLAHILGVTPEPGDGRLADVAGMLQPAAIGPGTVRVQ